MPRFVCLFCMNYKYFFSAQIQSKAFHLGLEVYNFFHFGAIYQGETHSSLRLKSIKSSNFRVANSTYCFSNCTSIKFVVVKHLRFIQNEQEIAFYTSKRFRAWFAWYACLIIHFLVYHVFPYAYFVMEQFSMLVKLLLIEQRILLLCQY